MHDNKKNIAVILNGPIKNDSRVIKICKSLSKLAQVHLFYTKGNDNDNIIFTEENIFLYNIRYPVGFRQRFLQHSFFYGEFNFYVKPVLNSNIKFDLIYANDLPSLKPAIKIKKHFKAKLIYDSHEIYIETINQFFLWEKVVLYKYIILKLVLLFMQFVGKIAETRMIRRVDYMFTVNESLKQYFIENYSVNNIDFLYNAPSLANIGQTKSNIKNIRKLMLCADNNDKIFLYQGFLNKGRGIEMLIDAFSIISADNIKLLIIGEGVLKQLIKQKIEDLELDDKVKLLGFVDSRELPFYTVQADFGLFFLETFNLNKALASPNKIFQYIHAELPILTNYTTENDKIFKRFNIGIQTELNMREIVKSINYLAQDGDKYQTYVSGCKKAKQVFNWEKQEQKLLNIAKKLLMG